MNKALVEAGAGAAGAVLATLTTFPLKTLSTLQALSTHNHASSAPVHPDAGRLTAVFKVLHTYKLSTLYAGLGPNLTESALSNAVYFYFYSKFRAYAVSYARQQRSQASSAAGGSGNSSEQQRQNQKRDDISVLASLLVATAAGACNQLITLPVSAVATKIQSYHTLPAYRGKRAPSTWETFMDILQQDGVLGFWKGLLPSMVLLVNPAVQYMLYEQLLTAFKYWKAHRMAAAATQRKAQGPAGAAGGEEQGQVEAAAEKLGRRCSVDSDDAMSACGTGGREGSTAAAAGSGAGGGKGSGSSGRQLPGYDLSGVKLSALEVFAAGALAKVGATVVTYPLIVVKARLQASSSKPSTSPSGGALRPASTLGIIADTFTHEGPSGFFKGLRAKILQTALNAALMLMIKEQLHGVTAKGVAAVSRGVQQLRPAAASVAAAGLAAPKPAAA